MKWGSDITNIPSWIWGLNTIKYETSLTTYLAPRVGCIIILRGPRRRLTLEIRAPQEVPLWDMESAWNSSWAWTTGWCFLNPNESILCPQFQECWATWLWLAVKNQEDKSERKQKDLGTDNWILLIFLFVIICATFGPQPTSVLGFKDEMHSGKRAQYFFWNLLAGISQLFKPFSSHFLIHKMGLVIIKRIRKLDMGTIKEKTYVKVVLGQLFFFLQKFHFLNRHFLAPTHNRSSSPKGRWFFLSSVRDLQESEWSQAFYWLEMLPV